MNELLTAQQDHILDEWVKQQEASSGRTGKSTKPLELRKQSNDFFTGVRDALAAGAGGDTTAPQWERVRGFLDEFSKSRARQGFSSSDTAYFIFSLKETLFNVFRDAYSQKPAEMVSAIMLSSQILDRLGIYTIEAFQRSREEVISRQQQELLELSTPVVKLWDRILALPLIGTLDSARTQIVMESLLQEIVSTGALIAIIDITGVPTVDTLVAQHLLKTVAAARLMGADCIISGIRPQIAQTIVHIGVELNDVITKATLADAFAMALTRTGKVVKRSESRAPVSSTPLAAPVQLGNTIS